MSWTTGVKKFMRQLTPLANLKKEYGTFASRIKYQKARGLLSLWDAYKSKLNFAVMFELL